MSKILLVFDYFKETFNLNKQNKTLYGPQIALIAVKVLMIVFIGIGIYKWIGIENINELTSMQGREIFEFVLSQGLKVLLIVLLYAGISVLVEAGLLNMYKKVVTQGYTEGADFREGISKYFLRLLAGELLILLCYIIASPFYLIIGLITLTVGLTVIPILASIFLTMWKVSLVMNDNGLFASIGDSFRFAKRNFLPLAFLQVIHFAFSQGASSGGGGGGGGNVNLPSDSQNLPSDSFLDNPGVQQGMEEVIKIFKIALAVIIPIVAVATIGASIIAMLFEVFFSLSLFVAYKNGFNVKEPVPEIIEAVDGLEEADYTVLEESQTENPDAAEDDTENSSIEEVEQ